MKNKLSLFVISGLMSATLMGCNNSDNSGNKILNKALESLAQGVTLDGSIYETASFLSEMGGEEIGETAETKYDFHYVFENREENAIERKVYAYEQDGSRYQWDSEVLVEGEDGAAYYNELGYNNKINHVPAVTSSSDKVNFGYYCDNPFRYLTINDFTKENDNLYILERKKASYLADKLFARIDEIFAEIIDKAQFIFEDDVLKRIVLEPIQIETYDTFGTSNRYFLLNAKAEIDVSNLKDATVTRPEARPHETNHEPLNNAFLKIGDNYTLTIAYNFEIDGDSQSVNYYQFFFTDEGVFWKCDLDDTPTEADLLIKFNEDSDFTTPYGYDSENNKFTTDAAMSNGFTSLFNAPKSLYVPIVQDVAAEIFDYDEIDQTYNICEELKSFIGIECFVPSCVAVRELNGFGTNCIALLNDQNELDQIRISYYRRDSFYDESGTFTLVYSDVGTTTLPYNFE